MKPKWEEENYTISICMSNFTDSESASLLSIASMFKPVSNKLNFSQGKQLPVNIKLDGITYPI
jgi:hypothetical protein